MLFQNQVKIHLFPLKKIFRYYKSSTFVLKLFHFQVIKRKMFKKTFCCQLWMIKRRIIFATPAVRNNQNNTISLSKIRNFDIILKFIKSENNFEYCCVFQIQVLSRSPFLSSFLAAFIAKLMLDPLFLNDFGRFEKLFIFALSSSGSWKPSGILDSVSSPKIWIAILTDLNNRNSNLTFKD